MLAEFGKEDVVAAGATDQDKVGAGNPGAGHRRAREFTKPALHPVAGDGVADFFADGIANAQRFVAVAAWADEQDEAGHGIAKAAICGQKLATFAKGAQRHRLRTQKCQADSFLRPWARRLARTLR